MALEFIFAEEPEINDRDKGYTCTHCKSFVKRYRRSFNSNMGLALLFLYHNQPKGFIHLENEMIAKGYKRSGDASYLRHYRLIEPMKAEREDGSSRNGFYRISGAGIMFAERKSTVQEYFFTFHNELEGFSGKQIDIVQALGRKYNYSEMMHSATWDSFIN